MTPLAISAICLVANTRSGRDRDREARPPVWSARCVGPVVSAQAAAAVLTSGETRLRSATGSTLAVAKLGRAARAASRAKITLRRSGTVKGKLVAGKVRVVVVRFARWRLDLTGGSEDHGHVPRLDSGKTLTDQVDEIERLIYDAQQQLSQATYALDTLKARIAASSGSPEDSDD